MSQSGGEKTEKATPKRREDAKKKGQVARGAELPTAFAFLTAILAASIFAADLFEYFGIYLNNLTHKITDPRAFTFVDVHLIFIEALKLISHYFNSDHCCFFNRRFGREFRSRRFNSFRRRF